jgi:hypothetical protein
VSGFGDAPGAGSTTAAPTGASVAAIAASRPVT